MTENSVYEDVPENYFAETRHEMISELRVRLM